MVVVMVVVVIVVVAVMVVVVVVRADNFVPHMATLSIPSRQFYRLLNPMQCCVHLCCHGNDNNGINCFFKFCNKL
jgi:hypothetical protein